MVARYQQYAAETYFPYPHPLRGSVPEDISRRKLVMVFTRDAIAKAAASAGSHSAVPAPPPSSARSTFETKS